MPTGLDRVPGLHPLPPLPHRPAYQRGVHHLLAPGRSGWPVADEEALGYLDHQPGATGAAVLGPDRRPGAGYADRQPAVRRRPHQALRNRGTGLMENVLGRKREGAAEDYEAGFRLEPGETVADILTLHRHAGTETDEIIAGIADLAQPVPVPRDAPSVPAGHRRLVGALGAAAPDRGDRAARRPRRHRPGGHRRRHRLSSDGGEPRTGPPPLAPTPAAPEA